MMDRSFPNVFSFDASDPLGVLQSCLPVLDGQSLVSIDQRAILEVAGDLAANHVPLPEWDADTHFHETGPQGLERTIGWIFALDALNFCFWSPQTNSTNRWQIRSGAHIHNGYMALAIALRDAARSGVPVWDPGWLTRVDDNTIRRLFRPEPGCEEIPLVAERAQHLRELSLAVQNGGSTPFTAFVEVCGHSASTIAQTVVERMPSFDDSAEWRSPSGECLTVRFHKRAQILASDLAGALAGSPHAIQHRGQLTAFADYKVPQVLRHLGILRYRPDLAETVGEKRLISSGSAEEIAIRATTIWGCELLRQALSQHGMAFTAADVDWLLWNRGQRLPESCEPYHRTLTRFY